MRAFILSFAAFGLALTAAGAAEWRVETVPIEDRKAVFATVESTHVTPARARIGGTVSALTVDEGARVEAGARIAYVGDVKLGIETQAQEARIASAAAARDQAKIEFDRATELRRTGAGTQARVDETRNRLEVTERNLAALRAERQVVVQRSAEGAVLAPASGRVLKVHITNGSVVLPGETVATIAVENYLLRLRLPERHARHLAVGGTVLVGERGPRIETETLREGKVVLVYPEIDQGRVVADVKVEGLGDYFVGERARVYVPTGTRLGHIVPPEFLFYRFGLAYVRLKDGAEIVVQPGQPGRNGIEILSGLKAGDLLVSP